MTPIETTPVFDENQALWTEDHQAAGCPHCAAGSTSSGPTNWSKFVPYAGKPPSNHSPCGCVPLNRSESCLSELTRKD